MLGREERAAVLVRNDRDRIGAEPLRLRGDLFLVHADERPQHRQRHHLGDARHVLERLRRDLPDHLTGDERQRPVAAGRSARRSASSAGGRCTTRSGGGTVRMTCCWSVGERHQQQPRRVLEPRQVRHQLARLLLRGARQHRVAVEVHEQRPGSRGASSATPQPASRCPPTAGTRPGRWSRPEARRRRDPCRRNRTLRRSAPRRESSAPGATGSPSSSRASLIRAADLTLDLGRRQRKALVGAARRQPERRRRACRRDPSRMCRGHRLDVERRPAGFREVADAEHPRQPIAHHAPVRRRAQDDLDTPHEHADRLHVEVRQSPPAGCAPAAPRTTGGSFP